MTMNTHRSVKIQPSLDCTIYDLFILVDSLQNFEHTTVSCLVSAMDVLDLTPLILWTMIFINKFKNTSNFDCKWLSIIK